MNFEDKGTHIFDIYKGAKLVDEVYLNEFEGENEIKLKPGQHTQLVPFSKDRDVLFLAAASGGGKSYFTLQYLKQYHAKYPKNSVYLFSSLAEDETLDKFKDLKRININDPEFLTEEFDINDFADACIVFDDSDVITNKFIRLKVQDILNMVLQTGRHTKTTVIYTSHVACAGHQTKMILNEAKAITFFPRSLGGRGLDYLLKSQMGLSNAQIDKVKSLKSRAITYIKTYPNLILYEGGAYLL